MSHCEVRIAACQAVSWMDCVLPPELTTGLVINKIKSLWSSLAVGSE